MKPIRSVKADESKKSKKRKSPKKKKKSAKNSRSSTPTKTNAICKTSVRREANEPLPEFAELVNALREKYSK